jgi:uncharacterized membrane protein YjdF
MRDKEYINSSQRNNNMKLKPGQAPIFLTNLLALIIFTFIFLNKQNYEFLIYIAVIVFFLVLVLKTNHKINYPNDVLWGLNIWAMLHMAGGGLFINGQKLYTVMLLNLVGEPYHIFKFDQFVHIVGFFVATLLVWTLLKPSLPKKKRWVSLSIVVVMAGLGLGALNEIIEFAATVILPETGVGGYTNTSLDLVSDLIGALLAMWFIRRREK